MHPLTTLQARGDALVITADSAELADHHWRERRRLLQLTGCGRLLLTIELPGCAPVSLTWELPPLPDTLPIPDHRRRPRRSVALT